MLLKRLRPFGIFHLQVEDAVEDTVTEALVAVRATEAADKDEMTEAAACAEATIARRRKERS